MSYDGYEYAKQRELTRIAKWNYADPWGWFEYVIARWWMPAWGIRRVRNRLYMSTGGWSGNEEIIGAMRKNYLLWGKTWYVHRTGGHFIFKVPPMKKVIDPKRKGVVRKQ